ncbi:ATP-binding domain-containing protein [Pseudoxanthomonas mexicana]|uniref:ATP-binding domain-containing protein n=1 Tax=Pseudoxanthomonas mexicana TaxID=128785 RepID=UPI000A3FFDE2|nr:ATP-binding domain-containing protein [Pseudoxanthomonas mexicana]
MEDLQFDALAEEALDVITEISGKAELKSSHISGASVDGLASGNTLTGGSAFQQLEDIRRESRDGYQVLRKQPAIARVIAIDDDNREFTFYLSRKGVKESVTLAGGRQLASYESNFGRLAALPVGEEGQVEIHGQVKTFYVVEKTMLHPRQEEGLWDSLRNEYRHERRGTYTIESFRRLLAKEGIDDTDELDRLLSADGAGEGVAHGISHQVRTAMALRDQPILDKFQDEIFRLPVNSQLIILGPPGTGKTTTLIKRLGQKLNPDNLDAMEGALMGDEGVLTHAKSWLMFTPSDLLKEYLKEAFGHEQVVVEEDRIKTWDSYRRFLARNTLGVLKSPNGGRFHLKESMDNLLAEVLDDPREWFDAFRTHHAGLVRSKLEEGALIAITAATGINEALVDRLQAIVERGSEDRWVVVYRELDALEGEIRSSLDVAKTATERFLKQERNTLYNSDKAIFAQLSKFLDSIGQDEDDDSDEDAEFDEDESEVDAPVAQTDVQRAVKVYLAAIRTLARYKYLKRSVSKESRAAKVRDWLGERMPSDDVLTQIGQGIAFQNGLRRFSNASKRFVIDVPQSYRSFRKERQAVGAFFSGEFQPPSHLSPTEVDAIILLMLRNARQLLSQSFIVRELEAPRFQTLPNLSDAFRNQVMVDEATDFSVLQLACMESLTTLKGRSFFACGDFNQRITRLGIRSSDHLEWVSSAIQQKSINVVYRQSRRLNQFSSSLLESFGGDVRALGSVPQESTHDGVAPILLENAIDVDGAADWIANRIIDVWRTVSLFPTMAVFVNGESEVKQMAAALSKRLEAVNLRAIPCEDGKALGDGNEVRVFDVRHIKGLEFEAVFFAGVDHLAVDQPALFQRYLYVGATRAATYLGLACYGHLPAQLEPLRDGLAESW